MDRSQRRRRTLRPGPVLLAASGLTVAPALVGEAAEPPFDASVSEACVNFGQGPSGGLGLEGQVSVTGAGPLRTVQARISWQGGDSADGVAVLCIADGDIVSASVSPTSSPANELTATFTVGLATSNPDLAIDSGDQVCNVGVVYAEAQVGISDIFCTDPIDLPPPDLVDEPLPSTGGSPHAGLLAGGALALLVGAMAMIIARRRTMTG